MGNLIKRTYKIGSLMVLGTSSGSGKSLMATAICRVLKRLGHQPIPFKGQNMSNNAWVDPNGGEMAYSQALQAWAAEIEPNCSMNPILLKPKGDSTSEVIHLGKSVGITEAKNYYSQWFESGWESIKQGLNLLQNSNKNGTLIAEGAGSPVEINLMHRDLTNLRLAKFINAKCLLVADIERGGVFAQIIGTLSLMQPEERKLVKGILINKFRGDRELFEEGRNWICKETGIPVIGIMPWLNDLFPPEDSLDLIQRYRKNDQYQIEIAVIKLRSISNFSDLDPLEAEPTIKLVWVEPGGELGRPDAIIIPGSKQTINDLNELKKSGLAKKIIKFVNSGGSIFGICGGLQIIGRVLKDEFQLENHDPQIKHEEKGLNLMPIETIFEKNKVLNQRNVVFYWPYKESISGFELHHGRSNLLEKEYLGEKISQISPEEGIGWYRNNKDGSFIAGTYLHGIFENGNWRRHWINILRNKKGLENLKIDVKDHKVHRNLLIDTLADIFEDNVDLTPLIKG